MFDNNDNLENLIITRNFYRNQNVYKLLLSKNSYLNFNISSKNSKISRTSKKNINYKKKFKELQPFIAKLKFNTMGKVHKKYDKIDLSKDDLIEDNHLDKMNTVLD